MKTKFKNTLLTVAVMTVFSIIPTTTLAATNATFIVNETNKKVIQTPHFYQKGFDHPGGYKSNSIYMCSHTALKSALATFRVTKNLSQIHADLQKVDKQLGYAWDYSGKHPKICPWGYCPHIYLMRELLWQYDRDKLGVSGNIETAMTRVDFENRIKRVISNGQVAIVLSRTYNFGKDERYAHWYVVHGYRVQNGKTYLYVRDPLPEYGGTHTDSHDYSVEQWWNWMNRNGNIQFLRVGRS